MLGGRHARARVEVHDIAFAVGQDLEQTFPQLRTQWFGEPAGLHVDSWLDVDGVDGWQVRFSDTAPAADAPRLFFVNLGGYVAGTFGEAHGYRLVVAADAAEAKRTALTQVGGDWCKPHRDALFEVDDCLPLDRVSQRYIHLVAGPHAPIQQDSDYLVLS
ncbi:MAG: DUF1543 domain-containing protein [Pseudomonas sp.]